MNSTFSYNLQIVRSIAVILVVLFHFFPTKFSLGYLGVDIFFVLSGFLIAYRIAKDSTILDLQFIKSFYSARLRRILPNTAIITVAFLFVFYLILSPAEYESITHGAFWGLLGVSNIYYFLEIDYFSSEASQIPFLHLWSLSIELQFYLIAPFLINVIKNTSINSMSLATAILFVVASYLNEYYPSLAFYLIIARLYEFFCGFVLYKYIVFQTKITIFTALFIFAIVSLTLLNYTDIFPNLLAVVVSCFLIYVSGLNFPSFFTTIMRPFKLLGDSSFSIYLIHWPIASFISFTLVEPDRQSRLIAAILSIVLGVLFASVTELRNRKGLSRTWRIGILSWLLVIVISLSNPFSFGWHHNENLDKFLEAKPAFIPDLLETNICKSRFGFDQSVRYCQGDPEGNPKMVVFGDSHAAAAYESIREIAPSIGLMEQDVFLFGGRALSGIDIYPPWLPDEKLVSKSADIVSNTLNDLSSVEVVVLIRRGAYYLNGDWILEQRPNYMGKNETSRTELYTNLTDLGLRNTLNKLERFKVYLVLDTPELNFHPRSCIPRPLISSILGNTHAKCLLDKKLIRSNVKSYNSIIQKIEEDYSNLTVIDPLNSKLCSGNFCSVINSSSLNYWDRHHLSAVGAKKLASYIKSFLEQ